MRLSETPGSAKFSRSWAVRRCVLTPSLSHGVIKKEVAGRGEMLGEKMEPPVRIELTTFRLQGGCSTTELGRREA